MKINIREDIETGDTSVIITMSRQYLLNECKPLEQSFARLITDEQGFGIIEDAILLSMKLKRVEQKPAETTAQEGK